MKALRESILDDDFLGDSSFLATELEKIVRAADKKKLSGKTKYFLPKLSRRDVSRIIELAHKEGKVPPQEPGDNTYSPIKECNVVLLVLSKSSIKFVYRSSAGSEFRSTQGTYDSDMYWERHINEGWKFTKVWINNRYIKEVYMLSDVVWKTLLELENVNEYEIWKH